MSLFTVKQPERNGGKQVRWCQRWDFADSIFTHQTGLFPVSTWPNLCSHHLFFFHPQSSCTCFISLFFSPCCLRLLRSYISAGFVFLPWTLLFVSHHQALYLLIFPFLTAICLSAPNPKGVSHQSSQAGTVKESDCVSRRTYLSVKQVRVF